VAADGVPGRPPKASAPHGSVAIMADLMIKILEQIRDELKMTRAELSTRIDQTNQRLDQTNQRLDHLERRQLGTEVRLATELVAVSKSIGDLKKVLLDDRKLRAQVENHEVRLKALERKRTG
jgi:vacuolar-type H+-ATPase subunit I/STV1